MAFPPAVKPGLTSREVDDLYSSVRDASRLADAKRDASPSTLKRIGERTIETLEVAAGAGAVGFVAGLTGTTSIGPVPIGLATAAAYYAAEAFDVVPASWSGHAENVLAKGGLAAFAAMWGAGQGYLLRQNKEQNAAQAERRPAAAIAQGLPAMLAGVRPAPMPATMGCNAPGQVACAPKITPGRLTEAELQAIDQRRGQRR